MRERSLNSAPARVTQKAKARFATSPLLKLEPRGSGDYARLTEMAQITARALSRNASGAQRRPVEHVRGILRRHAPRCQLAENARRIADAEIERVELRRVAAVDVVNRAATHMLPVEIEKRADDL